ncbi:MAG: ArsR/SmtB family transcription factor [Promethearchaeota archaeon]
MDSKENSNQNNNQDVEASFYYALGHELRRRIIKIIGDNEFSSFTELKKELGVSTGTIYHHLDTLSELIEQKEDKKYYLKELGVHAYNSLKDDIESIKMSGFAIKEFKSPILKALTIKRFIKFQKEDRIYAILISIGILIIGVIFCQLNQFYSLLLFFIEIDENNNELNIQILISLSFLLNFIIYFIIIEGISRLFYNKGENTLNFLESFAIIFSPMVIYLLLHYIFFNIGVLEVPFINFLDKILMIILQVWSIWLLSYSMSVKKGLKIENSLVVSLLLHYGGFTIILLTLI